MKTFRLNDKIYIVCKYEKTRNGFRHLASLFVDGWLAEKYKVTYLNRTWESYEFETVLHKAIDATSLISKDAKAEFKAIAGGKAKEEGDGMFKSIAMVAKMGEFLAGDSKKEKNDWKARMIKAGLQGVSIPDDWDALSEDEKERRLNGVISELSK